MNFSQMHERLRLILVERIRRGKLTVSQLARQTRFGQPHLSNVLNKKKQLSMAGVDRVLAAQGMTAADLLPDDARGRRSEGSDSFRVPLVSPPTAIFDPNLRLGTVRSMMPVPAGLLERMRPSVSHQSRKKWLRFVAVQISALDAVPMDPVVFPEAVLLVDRHYNSLAPYREGWPNLYVIRHEAHLKVRYADFRAGHLVLRPHNRAVPVDLLEAETVDAARELIIGRVVWMGHEW